MEENKYYIGESNYFRNSKSSEMYLIQDYVVECACLEA